jgi:anti-sigma factor RsiW
MARMNCPDEDHLDEYALYWLTPEEEMEVERHLEGCMACARQVRNTLVLISGLRALEQPRQTRYAGAKPALRFRRAHDRAN